VLRQPCMRWDGFVLDKSGPDIVTSAGRTGFNLIVDAHLGFAYQMSYGSYHGSTSTENRTKLNFSFPAIAVGAQVAPPIFDCPPLVSSPGVVVTASSYQKRRTDALNLLLS